MTRLSVVLTTVLTCAAAAPAGASTYFTGNLSGAQEVPANGSSATGFGRVTLNDAETQITVSVYYSGLGSNVTIGHLHGPAGPGTNAPIVFDLSPTPGVTTGSVVNAVFAITPTQVAQLKAGSLYFNIHTVNFSGGEIRGQVRLDAVQMSRLTSAQESPANGSTATGTGAVSINAAGTQALVSMTWTGLTGPATAGHAHFGAPKVNGPDVLDLSPAAAASGSVVDVLWNISPLQRAAIGRGQYYLNIHTATNPGGEIRGQILRRRATSETMLDQDGDGRADLSIARDVGGAITWWSLLSETNAVNFAQFGLSSDFDSQRLLMGDFDGDGQADRAVFRTTGQVGFWILYAAGGSEYIAFGIPGDDPRVIGDYDADGITDLAIFRTSTNTWWLRRSTDGAINAFQWGLDFPNPGDHDGDGRNDFTDQQGGIWWTLFNPGLTYRIQPFGNGNFIGTPGDFDGDGKTDIAGTNSEGTTTWYYISSLTPGQSVYTTRVGWGPLTNLVRVQGDYDGDGKTDIAIWNSSTRTYWVLNSSTGLAFIRQWGLTNDVPLAGFNNR